MGKLGNGPDMQDCSLWAKELEENHNCTITVLLELGGSIVGSHWLVHALAVPRGALNAREEAMPAVYVRFPHRDHKTFEGALFQLLVLLDAEFAKAEFRKIVNQA
jgi:hypothetical protein